MQARRRLPSWDLFEYDACCFGWSFRKVQTLEETFRNSWPVRSRLNHLHAEDGWEVRKLLKGSALTWPSLDLSYAPKASHCTFCARQSYGKCTASCTGTKRASKFSAQTSCARQGRRPDPGVRLTTSRHCWRRGCLPMSTASWPPVYVTCALYGPFFSWETGRRR